MGRSQGIRRQRGDLARLNALYTPQDPLVQPKYTVVPESPIYDAGLKTGAISQTNPDVTQSPPRPIITLDITDEAPVPHHEDEDEDIAVNMQMDEDVDLGPPPPPPGDAPNIEDDWCIRIPNWLVLWSIYLSSGASAVTQDQYLIIRSIITAAFHSPILHWRSTIDDFTNLYNIVPHQRNAALPSYWTIWKTLRPCVLDHLAVPSVIH